MTVNTDFADKPANWCSQLKARSFRQCVKKCQARILPSGSAISARCWSNLAPWAWWISISAALRAFQIECQIVLVVQQSKPSMKIWSYLWFACQISSWDPSLIIKLLIEQAAALWIDAAWLMIIHGIIKISAFLWKIMATLLCKNWGRLQQSRF